MQLPWAVGQFLDDQERDPHGGNSAIGSFIIKKPPGATISNPAGATFDLATLAATGDLKVSGIPTLPPKDQQGTHSVTISFVLTPESLACAGPIVWMPSSPQLVSVIPAISVDYRFAFTYKVPVSGLNQTTTFTTGTVHTVTGMAIPRLAARSACHEPRFFMAAAASARRPPNATYFLKSFNSNGITASDRTPLQCTVSQREADTTDRQL